MYGFFQNSTCAFIRANDQLQLTRRVPDLSKSINTNRKSREFPFSIVHRTELSTYKQTKRLHDAVSTKFSKAQLCFANKSS